MDDRRFYSLIPRIYELLYSTTRYGATGVRTRGREKRNLLPLEEAGGGIKTQVTPKSGASITVN